MWRWGLQGAGKVERRGWGGDSPWPPLPSHAPPCYVRSSRASSESCRWGQQDAGGSRGGRPGASAAQLAGPCGACVAAGARPQPHASPCSPGSVSGALPWPGGRGRRRVAPVLPGRRLDRGTLGAEGSQVSQDQHLSNVARSGGSADPSFERSGGLSWGFPAAASQKVFGIKVGSGETSGCSFGWGSCPLGWGDTIPSSTLVIFALGDLEPIA